MITADSSLTFVSPFRTASTKNYLHDLQLANLTLSTFLYVVPRFEPVKHHPEFPICLSARANMLPVLIFDAGL